MSSNSAGDSPAPKTGTHIGSGSSPGVDMDRIRATMTCGKFRDSVWGFVIYKCSQENESAWHRLLQALRSNVQDELRLSTSKDMLQFHDLHVIDDKALYGATSHQVREHFRAWVPKNLESRLRPDATNVEDDVDWLRATSAPRSEYCLFADDICLESLDHRSMNSPVVKILSKRWESPYPPHERNYTVPAPFHDGATEYDEEDVGWMYMPLGYYLDRYETYTRWGWDDLYVRPPFIDFEEDESDFVGHWRKKS